MHHAHLTHLQNVGMGNDQPDPERSDRHGQVILRLACIQANAWGCREIERLF